MKLLLVTNDFPPRVGGIQSYLWNIYRRLEGVEVTVFAPSFPGDAAFDRGAGMEVVRWPGTLAWPTPAITRRIRELATSRDAVAFGAVVPSNVVARRLDRPVLVHTHGFEVAWARLPVLRTALRSIVGASAAVTVVSEFTRRFIERVAPQPEKIHMLKTGVDLERFSPAVDATAVRKLHGLDARPVVSCVSRLVGRKGQDRLIEAMPLVRAEIPDAAVLITGRGPARAHLEDLARRHGVMEHVRFAGEVAEEDLPAHYAAGDVFAMPCRSRYGGLEVEGLGLVYLEAQACGRAAITGDSGGAPEAVIAGETGAVVPGNDLAGLAGAIREILSDPARIRSMGEAGRRFVEQNHSWKDVVARYRGILDRVAGGRS